MTFRHAVLTLLLVSLTACAGVDSYRDPIRVTVSGIQVLESTLLEQLYLVTLRIQNHNEEPISIRGGSFDLEINGKDFGSGVTDQAVTVPGYSDAKVEATTFDLMKKWRAVHLPITLAFAVLGVTHILSIFLFWQWK